MTKTNIKISETKVAEVKERIQPLIEAHWREIANYQDSVPLSPDWDMYQRLQDKGSLVIIIVEEDDQMIGYSVFIVVKHLHYTSLLVAQNDVLFLRADRRKAGIGLRLITESEKILKTKNVNKVQWHVKLKHDFSPLLERMGYMKEDIILGRII